MDYLLVPAGFAVGLLVGLTGVGGGALMTPMLILYGIPPAVAVGSDLIYAALTKSVGAVLHQIRRNIQWRIVGLMALGSLPASGAVLVLLAYFHEAGKGYESLITVTLGVALLLTACVTLLRPWLMEHRDVELPDRVVRYGTVVGGAFVGALVTLSSVGAGALGAAFLLVFYRRLPVASVVGTDLAHAVFLAALAGLGHWKLGAVNFSLLVPLLMGSIPGLYIGTQWATRMRDGVLRPVIAVFLLILGLGFFMKEMI